MENGTLRYYRGTLSAEQLQSEIDRFWHELAADSKVKAELVTTGLELDALTDNEKTGAITVHPGSSGADVTSAVLVVLFAPTANRVLKDLWSTILLPRIKRRWGDDAIGEQRSSQDQ